MESFKYTRMVVERKQLKFVNINPKRIFFFKDFWTLIFQKYQS